MIASFAIFALMAATSPAQEECVEVNQEEVIFVEEEDAEEIATLENEEESEDLAFLENEEASEDLALADEE